MSGSFREKGAWNERKSPLDYYSFLYEDQIDSHCEMRTLLVLVLSPFSLLNEDSCACVEPVFTVKLGLLCACLSL